MKLLTKKSNFKPNFVIHLIWIPYDILVSVNETDNNFIKLINKYKVDITGSGNLITMDSNNTTGNCFINKHNQCIIRIKTNENKYKTISTISHESLHAAIFILDNMGISLTDSSDEIYAYLQSYITSKICEQLKL